MARPREFDGDEVLEKALHVFWEKGFDGASLSDLLAAMGLTRSSLYKAFGSKEQLFRCALARYRRDHLNFRAEALANASPRAIVESLLQHIVALHTGPSTPPGCFETNGSIGCAVEGASIRADLIGDRAIFVDLLRQRFDATRTDRSFPAGLTSTDAAEFVATLVQGMAVQARAGTGRDRLLSVARAAVSGWPAE